MSTKEIIEKAISLPVEERTLVLDLLLQSLNSPEKEIDRAWILEAKKRLKEFRSGKIKSIPGDEVFQKIQDRFDK